MQQFLMILTFTLFTFFNWNNTKPVSSAYYARSYIVMNRDDKSVLEGKDIHNPRSVASISKVMTCIIALESEHIFDLVEADEETTKQVGSSIYLTVGEKLSVLDLCFGLMLRSGNDAAYALANYLGGSQESFVEKMNFKAKEIGMLNSRFNNPSGLDIDEEGNISTSYDMAVLLSYALDNELFAKIVKSENYSCQYAQNWINKNKLLRTYEYLDGGKTGYTYKAKRTLVTGATKDGVRLAICTLDCGSDFAFHKSLYEKYFNDYIFVEFLAKGHNIVSGYIVDSERRVGLMVSRKDYEGGVKLYQFTVDGELIRMSFHAKDGKITEVKI